jgi:hypothetical protein
MVAIQVSYTRYHSGIYLSFGKLTMTKDKNILPPYPRVRMLTFLVLLLTRNNPICRTMRWEE